MKKTLLLCLALLFPVNIHSDNRGLFIFVGASTLCAFTLAVIQITEQENIQQKKERTLQEIQKTQQEIEKTQQEIEKTKQLNLTIAIKKQIRK